MISKTFLSSLAALTLAGIGSAAAPAYQTNSTPTAITVPVYIYICTGGSGGTNVGHVWLGFEAGGHELKVGFYPKSSGKKGLNGPGALKNDCDRNGPGADPERTWSYRYCYMLPPGTAIDILDCIIDDINSPPPYQLFPNAMSGPGTNCGNWATGKMSSAGVPVPGGGGSVTPNSLGQGAWDSLDYQGNPNGPGGSTIQSNPNFPLTGPPASGNYANDPFRGSGGQFGLCANLMQDPVDFEARTALPVHSIQLTDITVFTDEIIGIVGLGLNDNLYGSGFSWGDGSGQPYKTTTLGFHMADNNAYMKSFGEAGTHACKLALFLENAVEVYTFNIIVQDGQATQVHRRNITASSYADPGSPLNQGTDISASDVQSFINQY